MMEFALADPAQQGRAKTFSPGALPPGEGSQAGEEDASGPSSASSASSELSSSCPLSDKACSALPRRLLTKSSSCARNPFAVTILAFVVYGMLSVALYMPLEDWSVGEIFYFAVAVVTSVGYGDIFPTSHASQWVTIFYCHFAMIVVVCCLTTIHQMTIVAAVERVRGGKRSDSWTHPDRRKCCSRWRYFLTTLTLHLVVVCIGTIGFAHLELYSHIGDVPHPHYALGAYVTVITLTTVGFGDVYPTDDAGRVFSVFLMLLGIPTFAAALDGFASLIFGSCWASPSLDMIQKQHFCKQSACQSAKAFVKTMRAMALPAARSGREGDISQLEFCFYVLCENGCCKLEELVALLRNFDELRESRSGALGEAEGEVMEYASLQ